jgi:hypothetical protein
MDQIVAQALTTYGKIVGVKRQAATQLPVIQSTVSITLPNTNGNGNGNKERVSAL